MDYQTITLSVSEGLAKLTLNRPEQANAMNPLMAKELSAAATHLAEISDLRCVCSCNPQASFFVQGVI